MNNCPKCQAPVSDRDLYCIECGAKLFRQCSCGAKLPLSARFCNRCGLLLVHEYVDLGLPSGALWATCNLGASKPEDYGSYFAWGETESKFNYNWETYRHGEAKNLSTKYCELRENGKDGFVDNKRVLDPSDDAAMCSWGADWRLPTQKELMELREKCTWETMTQNGVNGCKLVGPNGNYIFLPAAGLYQDDCLVNEGRDGYYWSSERYGSLTEAASLNFGPDIVDRTAGLSDCYGQTIRPVYGNRLELSKNDVSIEAIGGKFSIDVSSNVTWTVCSNQQWCQVSKTSGTGNDSFSVSVAENMTFSDDNAVITVKIQSGKTQMMKVRRKGYVQEYVDLELPSGTLWATCNIGAPHPWDKGNLYAWGETKSKTRYEPNNFVGAQTPLSDNRYFAPEDDAATVNWGGEWRMPTVEEWVELKENAKWERDSKYGFFIVRGRNGKSIHLPVVVAEGKSSARYWASNAFIPGGKGVGGLFMSEIERGSYRGVLPHQGCMVRPVYGNRLEVFNKEVFVCKKFIVGPSGGEFSTQVCTSAEWSVSSDQDWCQPSCHLHKGSGVLDVTVASSKSLYADKAILTISNSSGKKQSITVLRDGVNSHTEYVDLGLPSRTLWATCNVGAPKPEQAGKLFVDDTLDVNWECQKWIPNEFRWCELFKHCDFDWACCDGMIGYSVTSQKNGNSIFLPVILPEVGLDKKPFRYCIYDDKFCSRLSFRLLMRRWDWDDGYNSSYRYHWSKSIPVDDIGRGDYQIRPIKREQDKTPFSFESLFAKPLGGKGKKSLSLTTDGCGNQPEKIAFEVNGVSFTMVKVEGGTFMMGATPEQGEDVFDDERPVHQVSLDDYYIGKTHVTQALWQAVMGKNPSTFKGKNNPVECVSWDDCQKFVKKLSKLTGRQFRLPTEAEWEYAARGGNKSKGYKYAGSNDLDAVAWYDGNSSRQTHPVAQKAPNELGLYDMSGNVCEWCADWFGSRYSEQRQHNPTGPASGSYRVARGGSWGSYPRRFRVSGRFIDDPDDRDSYLGLRLVLVPSVENEKQGTKKEKNGRKIVSKESRSAEREFGPIDGHEYVDLGLPSGTLWATCNVGANAPEEYGDYFAWGETKPKCDYDMQYYKHGTGFDSLTKYCNMSKNGYSGFTDNKMELERSDDAATANWGKNWRMPNWKELKELFEKCNSVWTTQGGKKGRLFTGLNGNKLFLPAAGGYSGDSLCFVGIYGTYWSSSLDVDDPTAACYLIFDSDDVGWNISSLRDFGQSVRPVVKR